MNSDNIDEDMYENLYSTILAYQLYIVLCNYKIIKENNELNVVLNYKIRW